MKKSILLIFIVFCSLQLIAQNNDEFTGIANYSIRLAGDIFLFDGKLIFTSTESFFVYKQNKDKRWIKESDDRMKGQLVITDSNGYQIYTDLRNKKMKVREICRVDQALIYSDSVNIKWQLEDEQKIIKGLKCGKAQGHFRGRDYIAWYALDIPSSAGPWKFNGLPGLIIKVEESKNEVFIVLSSLKMEENIKIPHLASGTEMSLQGFLKNMEASYEEEFIKNAAAINQLQSEFPDIEINNAMPQKRPVTELNYK